jgi:hypothetical protein
MEVVAGRVEVAAAGDELASADEGTKLLSLPGVVDADLLREREHRVVDGTIGRLVPVRLAMRRHVLVARDGVSELRLEGCDVGQGRVLLEVRCRVA